MSAAPSADGTTAVTTSPPPAVFLQVSSLAAYTPATVRSWLKTFCSAAAQPPELVLQDVASADGVLLTKYLDAIAPVLPGGNRACFGRVYVGTVDVQWQGNGTKYVEGIKDPGFRDKHLRLSVAAARAFRARYPYVRNDWYLTYEANLNELYYPDVAASYRSLLTREIEGLSTVADGRQVLWSPAFWYPYSVYRSNAAGMSGLRTQLAGLFTAAQSASRGRMQVALQDFVGGSSCEPTWNRTTPSDAVGWTGFLRSLGPLNNVTLNVEQFVMTCQTGGITAADPVAIRTREQFYRSAGVTLGPAFELRYWLPTHLPVYRLGILGL